MITEDGGFQLIGTYEGHQAAVYCAMERDSNSILTGSSDYTIKIWNTTTCECLDTLYGGLAVHCLLKAKNNSYFVYGLDGGIVEAMRLSDFGLLLSFRPHSHSVASICELERLDDGEGGEASSTTTTVGLFVSASFDRKLKMWDLEGRVLRTFHGHCDWVQSVVMLNRDQIVSTSNDKTIRLWSVATGKCLRTSTLHSEIIVGLDKLKKDNRGLFVSGSCHDRLLAVWDEEGNCIETIQTQDGIGSLTALRDGSLLVALRFHFELRKP